MDKMILLARQLRKNQTPQEQKLWNLLRKHQLLGFEFRRQYPIGNYIVDFVCRKKKLIIELDGGQHNEIGIIDYDINRTLYLNSVGYTVLRFWNNDIDENIEGVLQKIKEALEGKSVK